MRRSSTRIGALEIILLGAGCVWPNPAFDVGGQATADPSVGSGDESATSPPTTGPTNGPTTGPTTGVDATGPTTGDASATGGEVSSETGEPTTGGPVDCWAMSIDAWTVESLVLNDQEPRSPTVAPDGLSLYYHGPYNGARAVFRVPLGGPGDPFQGQGELFHFEQGLMGLDYPVVRKGEEEMFFMQGNPGDIYVARKVAGVWQAAGVAGGVQLFGGKSESHPNITEDGALLLFQRQDGPGVGALQESWNFYQAQRPPQLATFPDVAPTQVTPTGSFFVPVCPALSPDGLHLFFAASDSAPQLAIDELNDGRVGVWHGKRAAATDPGWTDVTRIAALRASDVITCPTAVTADGCQMTLVKFRLDNATYIIQLAHRG